MHILVVHQYYMMPGQPGGSRFNEFARLWCDAGHRVTVIAGNCNYATGLRPSQYGLRPVTRERDGDVDVLRCFVPEAYNKGYGGRMLAFGAFTASSTAAVAQVRDPDVVIATSPPLTTAITGFVASRGRTRRVPWIFEMRDLWPESAITTGVLRSDAPLTKGLYALERWGCRVADRVNVLTPAFRDDLIRRGLADASKIVFVPNGADVTLFQPGPRENAVRSEYGWGDRFVALYAGAHGRANALRQLLDAAERLRARPDVLIASVGDGPERAGLQAEAIQRGLDNVAFLGAHPKERMPDFVRACDVGLAVLQDNPTFRTVYPNKVFDYMACERPTVLAIDGVARKLVCEDAGAGVFATPESGDEIAAAIAALAADPARRDSMGRAGRKWVLAHATRESLASRYLDIMGQLVKAEA